MNRLFSLCAMFCLTVGVSSAVDVRISEIENKADYFFARGQIDGALSNQGHIIDTLVSTNLHSDWKWIDANRLGAGTDETAILVVPHVLGRTNMPPQLFITMRDRVSANGDMADRDHDGSPNVYEINNGTNPYVADFENAPKVAVPPDCDYSAFTNALWSSAPYSIIEIAGEMYFSQSIDLPGWPLMITGPTNGYAVIHSGADIGVFMVNRRQTDHTLIRNVYLTMDRKSSFQAGFWIGGNLPWTDEAAGASFENVRLRMYNPGTWYYGWHMYGVTDTPVVISNCTISAAGAMDVLPVYVYGDSQVVVTNGLDLVNMPGAPSTGDYTWTGYSLTKQYDTEKDSDGDRISDHDEVRVYGTDPYLKDSDGDRINDWEEIHHGSNPTNQDVSCFGLTVCITNDAPGFVQVLCSFEDSLGTPLQDSPSSVTGRVCEIGLPHLVVTNGVKPRLRVWSDVNTNGVWDSGEPFNHLSYSGSGHERRASLRVDHAWFDADKDGLPDIWELQHGLSPTNALDAYIDGEDQDGLINLHEYWAGCDPNVFDGTNTALYAAVHGVDDRLAGKNPGTSKALYLNYKDNIRTNSPPILVDNPDSWATEIINARFSVWTSDTRNSREYFMHPLNLVTPQHVIGAKHCHDMPGATYWFRGRTGQWYVRTLVATNGISGTDIAVGLLDSPLPTNDVFATALLPANYEQYLGSLRRLPVVQIDQDKNCLVQEISNTVQLATGRFQEFHCSRSIFSVRASFYEGIVLFDSGSPCYLFIGDEPVLLYAIQGRWNDGSGAGYHTALFRTEIQELFDGMSDECGVSRYQIKEIDLSRFEALKNGGR